MQRLRQAIESTDRLAGTAMKYLKYWIAGMGGAGLVAAGVLLWRRRQGERVLHYDCPGCGRRLRYKTKSAGGHGLCPQCGEKLTFPK